MITFLRSTDYLLTVSKRGPQFVSQFRREFCRQIGNAASLSSGFYPRTNGQAQSVSQILGRLLHTLAAHNPTSWCEQLPWAEYPYNSLPSSSTMLSPFHCCLGNQPPLFSSQESEVSVPSVQAPYQMLSTYLEEDALGIM